jgi:DNA-binding CsgD family transcriptional regulator
VDRPGRCLFFGETLDADKITRIFGGKEKLEARKPQGLTPRELEVLQLTTSGYSNGQIAAALEITLNTVDSYKERSKGKFGLDSMVECVAHAVAKGIVTV